MTRARTVPTSKSKTRIVFDYVTKQSKMFVPTCLVPDPHNVAQPPR